MSQTATIEDAATALREGNEGADPEAVREAARQMGSVRSERKASAVRENGKLGGRPKGTPHSEETRQKQAEAARLRWAKRKGATGEQTA